VSTAKEWLFGRKLETVDRVKGIALPPQVRRFSIERTLQAADVKSPLWVKRRHMRRKGACLLCTPHPCAKNSIPKILLSAFSMCCPALSLPAQQQIRAEQNHGPYASE
jgi:hypothetical protein